MLFEGDVQKAISLYNDKMDIKNAQKSTTNLNPELTSLRLLVNGRPWEEEHDVDYGANLKLDVDVARFPKNTQVRVLLKDASQSLLMDWNSARANLDWPESKEVIRVDLGPAELASGVYSLSVQVMSPDGREPLCLSEPLLFRVTGKFFYNLAIQREATWTFMEVG
jgi:lipopolysaccharide transport system ATP-binding protein